MFAKWIKSDLRVSGPKWLTVRSISKLKRSFMRRPWHILLKPGAFTPCVLEKEMLFKQIRRMPHADLVDQVILQALVFQPFASARQISCMILLSRSAVERHLTESLGSISKGLQWVLHRRSDIEKEARVEKLEELLQLLLSMKHQSWKSTVTLDEAQLDF
jgi:hypothetical protein